LNRSGKTVPGRERERDGPERWGVSRHRSRKITLKKKRSIRGGKEEGEEGMLYKDSVWFYTRSVRILWKGGLTTWK